MKCHLTGGTKGGLDGNTNAGINDLFVVKYNFRGTKQLGSSGLDYDYGSSIILTQKNIQPHHFIVSNFH